MSSSPITKTGIDRPTRTATLENLSNRLRALVALMMPTVSPATSHRITPPTTRESVGGRSCFSIVSTDSPVKYEQRRSPWTRSSRKCQYCTMIGWLRPRFLITSLITWGVAARPASWRATVSTGRAKNKKNAPLATSQITTAPVRMRRTRNPSMAMSVASRRRHGGRHVGRVESAASAGGLVAPSPQTAPPRGENPLCARRQRGAYPVAEQVERERGDEQRRRGEDHVPPGHLVEVLRVGQDVPPARYRRLDAETQERERRLEHHGRRDVQGDDHQHRCQQVGQDVKEHDPEGSGAQRPGRLDVFLFLYRQGLATDDPGDSGPGEERDDRDDHGQARTDHHCQREREHDVGERENRVGEAGQDRVHDPAEVPGDQANGDARDRAPRGRDEADEQR